MKRFDPAAITERGFNELQSKDKWKNIQKDGATHQFIEAMAEPEAEIARYGEYLLKELKWDTCSNYSSAKHMARMVSKKLNRKHSAIGTLIVSHSDLDGVDRVSKLGVGNLDVDAESNYDDLSKSTTLTDDYYKSTLVPWTDTTLYKVQKGDTFTTNSGIKFVCAETKTIKTWNSIWTNVKNDSNLLKAFRAAGGWNGYKYLLVPVVQGEEKDVFLGYSDNSAAQSFIISTLDVEAADSYYTKQFCYATITTKEGSTVWKEINHLANADSSDRVFEINILDDLSGTEIKFGDGISGAIPPDGAQITLHYLSTLGKEGNVTTLYNFKREIGWSSGNGIPKDTVYPQLKIGCQNMWTIVGGSDLETLKEFKNNAETAYAKNYEILHTYTELLDNINSISPIPLIKAKTKDFYKERSINTTKIFTRCIGVTGLSTAMEKFTETEQSLFNQTINTAINDKVLSNKEIVYVSPDIIEIDSCVELELKTPVLSKEQYNTEMEDHLQSLIGKTNFQSLDCYNQSEILKDCLEFSDNIASIQSTDLLTFGYSLITSTHSNAENTESTEDYIIVRFNLPELSINAYGKDSGYCFKTIYDGVETIMLINVKIGDNYFTFAVKDSLNTAMDSNPLSTEGSSYMFYAPHANNPKYEIHELQEETHVLTSKELSNYSALALNNSPKFSTKDPLFYVLPESNKFSVNFAINAYDVAKYLGFSNAENVTTNQIMSVLETSLQNNVSKFELSFVPTDKTVSGDWNTVMYYKNIEVIAS